MVQLHASGKPSSEIIREYDLTASAFHKWVKQYNASGSFKAADNLTPKVELKKQNIVASRRRIGRIMAENGLVSAYTVKQYEAIASVKTNLHNFQIFHTDRGSEFKNFLIDDMLKVFNIRRSLSAKGCPYDNAVAEAQFKIIKTEFKQALL